MNKELLVINENGNATKLNIESGNMHDLLLLENNLERINEIIIKLEKAIYHDEEIQLTKKEKVILAMMPFILGMSAYGITCLISPSVISDIIPTTIGIALGTTVIDVSFILSTGDYPKHINGLKCELSTAYQLKEELEQKLTEIKEKSKDFITPNIVNQKINDAVILEESTQFCEKLYESYTRGYRQKVKRLTLKK